MTSMVTSIGQRQALLIPGFDGAMIMGICTRHEQSTPPGNGSRTLQKLLARQKTVLPREEHAALSRRAKHCA